MNDPTWFCMCAWLMYISTCVHMCEGLDVCPCIPWVKLHLPYERDPALAQSSCQERLQPGFHTERPSPWVSLGAELLSVL